MALGALVLGVGAEAEEHEARRAAAGRREGEVLAAEEARRERQHGGGAQDGVGEALGPVGRLAPQAARADHVAHLGHVVGRHVVAPQHRLQVGVVLRYARPPHFSPSGDGNTWCIFG